MPDGSKYLNLFKFLAIIGGGYFMSKNADKMWEELFGSSNIKAEQYSPDGHDFSGTMFGSSTGGTKEPRPTTLDDIEITLDCSLTQFYEG